RAISEKSKSPSRSGQMGCAEGAEKAENAGRAGTPVAIEKRRGGWLRVPTSSNVRPTSHLHTPLPRGHGGRLVASPSPSPVPSLLFYPTSAARKQTNTTDNY